MDLPPECIHLILIHLKADINTLHSCLLVDRLWCSETVRILWHQPFRHLYTVNYQYQMEKRKLRAGNLILTYLSCILYQYNEELVKNFIIPKPVKKPLFNYIQFLKNLDLIEFSAVIKDCINSKNITTIKNYRLAISYILLDNPLSKPLGTLVNGSIHSIHKDLLDIMSKLITDHSAGLYRLLLDAEGSEERAFFKGIMFILLKYHQCIMKIINSKGHLSQLTELIMPTRIFNKTEILLALIPVSRNLKKIVVRAGYRIRRYPNRENEKSMAEQEAKALADLITAQKSLEHLGLHSCAEGLDYLLTSIESQADTLKYLSFVKVRFCGIDVFKHMAPLRNLEQIQFNCCTFKPKDASNPYHFENNFPKLVKLEIQRSINADYAIEILRSAACGSLNVESEPRNSIFDLEY
ncbi:13795_t:CDS:1 [Acaulospora morrowiae]|uniref:13795_t:CDS:1 n=1 Tax=Acaulospora morrowiae TaxID=94023 RepID=A0A9N8VVW4_9GLOM|nr:13795_t:CDS:1 [Acaulospora morrowiae]